jgi:hypothetical protein
MRLVDAHYPFMETMGLILPHEVLLRIHLADGLHIGLVFLIQRVLAHRIQQSVYRLQIPPHIVQLLAYRGFQLRTGPFLLLGNCQVVLPRSLTIRPRLHRSMKLPDEILVDDHLSLFPARIQKSEVRRIGDVLWAGCGINQQSASVP